MLRWFRFKKENNNAALDYKISDEERKAEARKRYVEAEHALAHYRASHSPVNSILR